MHDLLTSLGLNFLTSLGLNLLASLGLNFLASLGLNGLTFLASLGLSFLASLGLGTKELHQKKLDRRRVDNWPVDLARARDSSKVIA